MKLITAILDYVLGRKNIGSVLGSLEKPLNDLKVLQQQHAEKIAKNEEKEAKEKAKLEKKLAKLSAESAQKKTDAERAKVVHANLEKLLGLDLNKDGQVG